MTSSPADGLLADESATLAAGASCAGWLQTHRRLSGAVILLNGDLGAGKTTFARGFLQHLGHTGPVRSPTYTLIERYPTAHAEVCHLDLYRLDDPDELDYIGFRDLLEAGNTLLIEWPQRVADLETIATGHVTIDYHHGGGRKLATQFHITAS